MYITGIFNVRPPELSNVWEADILLFAELTRIKNYVWVKTCLIREYISWWNDVVGLENKQSIITTKKLYTEVSMDTMQSRVCWP